LLPKDKPTASQDHDNKPIVSVVIPVHNEAEGIQHCVREIDRVLWV